MWTPEVSILDSWTVLELDPRCYVSGIDPGRRTTRQGAVQESLRSVSTVYCGQGVTGASTLEPSHQVLVQTVFSPDQHKAERRVSSSSGPIACRCYANWQLAHGMSLFWCGRRWSGGGLRGRGWTESAPGTGGFGSSQTCTFRSGNWCWTLYGCLVNTEFLLLTRHLVSKTTEHVCSGLARSTGSNLQEP